MEAPTGYNALARGLLVMIWPFVTLWKCLTGDDVVLTIVYIICLCASALMISIPFWPVAILLIYVFGMFGMVNLTNGSGGTEFYRSVIPVAGAIWVGTLVSSLLVTIF